MQLDCKLIKKTFTDEKTGLVKEYYALQFPLVDGSSMDVTIKSDKAKILIMSASLERN